ncbi:MAG: hypothetical protein ABS36_18940 [Acidobacteria bacterium SCN 69-37]|nr:MAG: hypothetical protein ABS36_18940 [Acidobacteria bacterium SCN 69-37]
MAARPRGIAYNAGIVPAPTASKRARGRPTKFGRPSKAVTVTLPEDVLDHLRGLDADLGRAIVRVTEKQRPARPSTPRAAEVSRYGRNAVIVVTPLRALKRLPGIELVPIGDGRALISLAPGRSIPEFELEVRDAAAEPGLPAAERDALTDIASILKGTRARGGARARERTIIVLESSRR